MCYMSSGHPTDGPLFDEPLNLFIVFWKTPEMARYLRKSLKKKRRLEARILACAETFS